MCLVLTPTFRSQMPINKGKRKGEAYMKKSIVRGKLRRITDATGILLFSQLHLPQMQLREEKNAYGVNPCPISVS